MRTAVENARRPGGGKLYIRPGWTREQIGEGHQPRQEPFGHPIPDTDRFELCPLVKRQGGVDLLRKPRAHETHAQERSRDRRERSNVPHSARPMSLFRMSKVKLREGDLPSRVRQCGPSHASQLSASTACCGAPALNLCLSRRCDHSRIEPTVLLDHFGFGGLKKRSLISAAGGLICAVLSLVLADFEQATCALLSMSSLGRGFPKVVRNAPSVHPFGLRLPTAVTSRLRRDACARRLGIERRRK
jgi:hypothetical protein